MTWQSVSPSRSIAAAGLFTRVLCAAAILFMCSGLSAAQDLGADEQETVSTLAQQVRELRAETEALRKQLNELQTNNPASAAVQPSALLAETNASQPEPSQGLPSAPEGLHDFKGIQWRGFGEVDYKGLDQRQPELGTYGFVAGSAANFYTGDFDLFLHSRISARTSVQADLVVEELDAQDFSVDLRQMLLKFDWNDHFKLAFGRYQTGIGYYNWAFRSAAWLQTTADRPFVMEYAANGGILPTQAIGVSVTGSIPSGKLGLNYLGEYGSSDTIRPDINGSGLLNDENDGNHILFGLYARPDWAQGLQVGASFFHDKISDSEVSLADRYGQTILNGYVVYVGHKVEALNEAFLIRQTQLATGLAFNTPAFYSQISRQWWRIRPFARYQYVNASDRNTIYNDVGLRAGPSIGIRYDPSDYISLKAQIDHTLRRGLEDLDGAHLQIAFTF